MVASMGKPMVVELAKVRENPEAIRAVNVQGEEYLGILESIRLKGFNGVVTVAPVKGTEDEFAVVDGMHRYMAAKEVGLSEIPVIVVDLDEAGRIEYSIMANVHSKKTAPSEYCKGCLKLLQLNPMLTEGELAAKLGKSPTWLRDIMRLNNIENPEIMAMIDDGRINLTNAYALAKLPPEEMADFITEAQTEAPETFVNKITERVKAIRDAKRKGEEAEGPTFSPSEWMQKLKDIKEQRDTGEIADALIAETGVTAPRDAFILALNWVLHADPFSIEEQRQEFEQKQALKAEKDKQRQAEKAAKLKAKKEEELKAAIEAEAAAKEAAEVEA